MAKKTVKPRKKKTRIAQPEPRANTEAANDPLVLVFMPALAPLLVRAEMLKAAPLTEKEVLSIRGRALCVTMPRSHAEEIAKSRGYSDIDPEDCWQEWLALRAQL